MWKQALPAVAQADVAEQRGGWHRLLDRVEALIFDQPLWHLLAAVAILNLVKNGIWTTPEISDWASMAKAFPNLPHLAGSSYILSSPVGPAVAHYLGATSPKAYEVFSFFAVLVAVAILVLGLGRAAGPTAQRLGIIALFASPLSNTLVTWLGKEDPFVILFTSLVFLFDSPVIALLGGVGLATANPEAGAVIVGATLLLRGLDPSTPRRVLVATATGFGAGLLLIAGYGARMGVPMNGRVIFVEKTGARTLIVGFLSELPTWVFSIFGGWWITIVAAWRYVADRRRVSLAVIAVLLACGAVSAGTEDQSRIYALLSLPVVLWVVCRATRRVPPERLRSFTVWTFVAAAVVPRVVAEGNFYYVSHMGMLLGSAL